MKQYCRLQCTGHIERALILMTFLFIPTHTTQAATSTAQALPGISLKVVDDPFPTRQLPVAVSNAKVFLEIRKGAIPPVPGSDGYTISDSTTTDVSGNARLNTVSSPDFRLTIVAAGYRSVTRTFTNVQRDTSDYVYLVSRDAYAGVRGHVINELTRLPIPRCTVYVVTRLTDKGVLPPAVFTAVTGTDGAYVFDTLPVPVNFHPVTVRIQNITSVRSFVDTLVQIRTGIVVDLFSNGGIAPRLAGTIYDDQYPARHPPAPIVGATVYLKRPLKNSPSGIRTGGFGYEAGDSAITNEEGVFLFNPMLYDRFYLSCSARGYRTTGCMFSGVMKDTVTSMGLVANDVYAMVSGHVYQGSSAGLSRVAVPGCTVQVAFVPPEAPPVSLEASYQISTGITGPDGGFIIGNIPVSSNYQPVLVRIKNNTNPEASADTFALIRSTVSVDLYTGEGTAATLRAPVGAVPGNRVVIDHRGRLNITLVRAQEVAISVFGLDGRTALAARKNLSLQAGTTVMNIAGITGSVHKAGIVKVAGNNVSFIQRIIISSH